MAGDCPNCGYPGASDAPASDAVQPGARLLECDQCGSVWVVEL
jgi:formate dehydrogenase maturation protein FdhE